MKRIIAIVLLCWSAGVMAEPIEMICKDVEGSLISYNLTINLATNKVQYADWDPLDIYLKNDKYIAWIGFNDYVHIPSLVLFSLDRKSGKLQVVSTNLYRDKQGTRAVAQCFRSF